MTSTTQNQKLRSLFRQGKSITSKEARKMGIKNLRSRVDELRQQGVFIYTTQKAGVWTYTGGVTPTKEFIASAYKFGGGKLFYRSATGR